jgi:hypothetical protein
VKVSATLSPQAARPARPIRLTLVACPGRPPREASPIPAAPRRDTITR